MVIKNKCSNSPTITNHPNSVTTRSITRRTGILNKSNTPNTKTPIKVFKKPNVTDMGVQADIGVERISAGSQTDLCSTKIRIVNELLSNEWISDDMLNIYSDLLNNKFSKSADKPFLIINPIIVQAIKCINDFNFLLDPLQLDYIDLFFLPVNDSKQQSMSDNGTHWSLLIFDRCSHSFYHIDSIKNSQNVLAAQEIADKLSSYFEKGGNGSHIIQIQAPQQSNSYDCGVFVVYFMELILSQILSNRSCPFNPNSIEGLVISETSLIQKRSNLAYIINNGNNISNDTLQAIMVQDREKSTMIDYKQGNLVKEKKHKSTGKRLV